MRTVEYRATHVPAFLTKLWKLVTDPGSDELISWSVGGTSFIIYDEIRFAKELLPMYFKHNNMASFVRQLNMYGFRKLSCIDQGGMHSIKHEIEFYHQYFIKDQENLLELIKRKIPSNRSSDDSKVKPEYVKELISNIKSLQGKQQASEEGMKNLRRENKLLWRQLALLNNRYMKQQAVLQQVLPLFMNMVQSSQRLPLKRRLTLMIHDGENEAKSPRIESPYYVEHEPDMSSALTPSPGNVSNRGPVITEMESSKMFAENILCSPNAAKENEVIVDSPLSSLESSDHTVDSPFTEAEAMEPLGILNCNFKSMNQISPNPMTPTEVSPPPSARILTPPGRMVTPPNLLNQDMAVNPAEAQVTQVTEVPSRRILTPPGLLVQDVNVPSIKNQIGSMNSTVTPVSSVPVLNQCSPSARTVPINMNPGTSYSAPSRDTCGDKSISLMNILNETSNHNVASAPAPLQPSAAAVALSSQEQAIENILNWLPNGNVNVSENEQNIDNWLGQLIRADNLAAGASLPARVGQNV